MWVGRKQQKMNHLTRIKNQLKLINRFADISGHNGLINGQMLDVKYSSVLQISGLYQEHLKIYELKTGYLFGLSAQAAAILTCQSKSTIEKMWQFGLNFGILFQLRDDLEDFKNKKNELNICDALNEAQILEMMSDYKQKLNNFIESSNFISPDVKILLEGYIDIVQ